jgi:SAM-dependent methyltransferase
VSGEPVPGNFRPGVYAGTAEAYARYRPPYPPDLLADLIGRVRHGADTTLVDLATGPGRVALDLAPWFERVSAVDLEPDMIAVARARAAARGLGNVAFRVARAEDLDMPSASVDLVTIGEAFHRLDQRVVAGNALRWLRPGGALATLGAHGQFLGESAWEAALREVRLRWVDRAFPDGWATSLPGAAEGPAAREALLREVGFVDIEVHPLDQSVHWTFDVIVGYLASSSVCSRKALGHDFDAWVEDLRGALRASSGTTFEETIHWDYMLARKPA